MFSCYNIATYTVNGFSIMRHIPYCHSATVSLPFTPCTSILCLSTLHLAYILLYCIVQTDNLGYKQEDFHMAILGCIADDFTGASDAASFLVKGGMSVQL